MLPNCGLVHFLEAFPVGEPWERWVSNWLGLCARVCERETERARQFRNILLSLFLLLFFNFCFKIRKLSCLISALVCRHACVRASQVTSGTEPTCQCRRCKRAGSIPESGRSPGGGHDNPLQCSYLENPVGRGGWRAAGLVLQRVRHDWSDLAHSTRLCLWRECFVYAWVLLDAGQHCRVIFVDEKCFVNWRLGRGCIWEAEKERHREGLGYTCSQPLHWLQQHQSCERGNL